ncbi:MAG: hypothetical protein A2W04_00265 [Betaproteobacteria bacterium RBG_16_64_9]|nr:MAG: hypothetical protein A2W04_00265 [Betaproteobacteria bacterium RBG_16_64_9]
MEQDRRIAQKVSIAIAILLERTFSKQFQLLLPGPRNVLHRRISAGGLPRQPSFLDDQPRHDIT